jgi:hypothetical protein
MNVYQLLLDAASEQLDTLSSKVTDEAWFDDLLGKLRDEVTNAELEPDLAQASFDSIDLLNDNKDLLLGLGVHAFKLFMFQICSGKCSDAIDTYISALSNADDLIALMNAGADGIIKAKKELDQLHADAQKLAMDLLTVGARYLIPFLLSLI